MADETHNIVDILGQIKASYDPNCTCNTEDRPCVFLFR